MLKNILTFDTLCFILTDGSYYSISQSLRADLNISSSYPSSVEETIFRLQDLFRRTGMFTSEGLWWMGDIFFYLAFIKMVTIWIYAILERGSYRSCDVFFLKRVSISNHDHWTAHQWQNFRKENLQWGRKGGKEPGTHHLPSDQKACSQSYLVRSLAGRKQVYPLGKLARLLLPLGFSWTETKSRSLPKKWKNDYVNTQPSWSNKYRQ